MMGKAAWRMPPERRRKRLYFSGFPVSWPIDAAIDKKEVVALAYAEASDPIAWREKIQSRKGRMEV